MQQAVKGLGRLAERLGVEMNQNAEVVVSVIAGQLRIDPTHITMENLIMEELGADSLDVVEMLVKLEELTGTSIPDEDIILMKHVGDVVAYLDRKI